MCKVSVVIPVYNVEPWLRDCLDSVLTQTLADIEVLCVDDASPDGCGRILDEYADRDARLRVTHLAENRQQGYGRNLGLTQASGRYVYFLDADDCIRSDALEKLYAAAEAERLDGIYFDSEPLFTSAELAKKYASYPSALKGFCPEGVCGGSELFTILSEQNQWTCYIQRQFWRRDFLLENRIRFPEGTEHEDELFSFTAVLCAERMRYLREPFFIRRYRPESVMTRRAHPKDFHGYFSIYDAMVRFVRERELWGVKGAQIQMGRILDRCRRFYPVFAAEAEPEAWFADERILQMYYCFSAAHGETLYDISAVSHLLPALDPAQPAWIYGAGVLGKRCFQGLAASGYQVAGFLVSEKGKNPAALFGRPVRLPEEVRAEGVVVIALSKGYQEDIHRRLMPLGWTYLDM